MPSLRTPPTGWQVHWQAGRQGCAIEPVATRTSKYISLPTFYTSVYHNAFLWLGSVLTYHYVTAEELERDVLPNIPELGTTGTRSDPGGVRGISRETGNDLVPHTNR